jgi:predicted outer membrane repeat protein
MKITNNNEQITKQITGNREQITKNKRFNLFPLLAVTCYLLFVLMSCQNLFEPSNVQKPTADGVGYVSLSIAGNGRTIMPTILQSEFDSYTLVFSPVNGPSPPKVLDDRNNSNLSEPISLSAEIWDLEITAYKSGTPVAQGNVTDIEIKADPTPKSVPVTLTPIASGNGSGNGKFKWNFTLPGNVTSGSMTVTPPTGGSSDFSTSIHSGSNGDDTTLAAGIYKVTLTMSNGGVTRILEEYLHIYPEMTSSYAPPASYFTGIFNVFLVTSGANSGPGTLRQAIQDAESNSMISIQNGLTITLTSSLSIDKNLLIEGNGATITQNGSVSDSLLNIYSSVVISRVRFKGGRGFNGGAIYSSDSSDLTLESCIFSDNKASESHGGAIFCQGTTTLRGCTFYENTAPTNGGAISNQGTLALTGNLFFGNTASSNPAVYNSSGTVTSGGYNVVAGTLSWATANGDKSIGTAFSTDLPISGKSFRLLQGSTAANVIGTRPEDYPTKDFYGVDIQATGAAAGAVQDIVNVSGYYLELSENINVSSPLDPDNNVTTGPVTLTPIVNPGFSFDYWMVNGVQNNSNPLTITFHAKVQVFISRAVDVTDESTLRAALNDQTDGDVITIQGVTPGDTTITLTSALPAIIKRITINGNGVVITQTGSNRLLLISGGTVTINRVHFKGGSDNIGGAIYSSSNSGALTVESCIFSDNHDNVNRSPDATGGAAIYSWGTTTVRGCTFYNNTTANFGGAIFNRGGTLTLTGNLFYGNTATNGGPVVYGFGGSTSSSGGYNVVDVASPGFTLVAGDTSISSLPISGKTFKLLPTTGDSIKIITARPANYPAKDFYNIDITATAAAGAVQDSLYDVSKYYVEWSLSPPSAGTVYVTPPLDDDGLGDSTTTLTANPDTGNNYSFNYWMVNGVKDSSSGAVLNIIGHTRAVAVFTHAVTVDNSADNPTTPGTLRNALNNAQDGDVITIDTSVDTITLSSSLAITKSVTINGNGVVITQTGTNRLLTINSGSGTVVISGIHFKDGNGQDGGAISTSATLTVESCIFSDNTSNLGGAIYSQGITTVKGCTFYNNTATIWAGAIYSNGTYVQMTGNLFYKNTSSGSIEPIIMIAQATSLGYNVVDVASPGFGLQVTDNTLETLLGDNETSPFTDAENGDFMPVEELSEVINLTSAIDGFPTKDFFDEDRTWPGAPGAVNYTEGP